MWGPNVEPGRSVLVNPWIGCGECRFCKANQDNLCNTMRAMDFGIPGGFATHVLVPHARHLVDAEGLDAATCAALACGGVGLAVLAAWGHRCVIACDIDGNKLARRTRDRRRGD